MGFDEAYDYTIRYYYEHICNETSYCHAELIRLLLEDMTESTYTTFDFEYLYRALLKDLFNYSEEELKNGY